MESLREEYNTTKKVNPVSIYHTFSELGSMMRGYKTRPKKDTEVTPDMWVLPNNNGLFGINTYLYAFFNGIYLIGIPDSIQFADGDEKCPYRFLIHDYFHSVAIKRELRNEIYGASQKFFYQIWQTILTDPTISLLEKENHILNLWLSIHERGFSILKYNSPIINFKIGTTLIKDFIIDRVKISSVVLTPKNLDLYLTSARGPTVDAVEFPEAFMNYDYNQMLINASPPFDNFSFLEDEDAAEKFITIMAVLDTINYLRERFP